MPSAESADEGVTPPGPAKITYTHIRPKENPAPKPPLSAVMSDDAIRAKVEDYRRKSNALEERWRRPITGDQLQAELDRMAHGSRDRRANANPCP